MISTKNVEEARKLIKKAEKPIIVQAQDDEFNRKILEAGKFNVLLSPEAGIKRDKPKQLDSGLNSVLAVIAEKNNIAIGIDIKDIDPLDKLEKAKRLARIKQNIKTCRKTKTKLAVMNAKDKKDASALLLSLGASTQQAHQATYFYLEAYQREV